MANFSELVVRDVGPETLEAFMDNFNTLGQTVELDRSLKAAQEVTKLLATMRLNALESIPAPEGCVIHIAPDIETGIRTQGEYLKPMAAFGNRRRVRDLKEVEVFGGHYEGKTFEGDSLVVVGSELFAVNEQTGIGCLVPEPPEKHILLSTVEPVETLVEIT